MTYWIEFLVIHSLQSSLFAMGAFFLTLLFRRNEARIRHWVWQVASLKFLVPFSFLFWLGATVRPVSWLIGNSIDIPQRLVRLSHAIVGSVPMAQYRAPVEQHHDPIERVALLLFTVWCSGAVLVAFCYLRRWFRVRETVVNTHRVTVEQVSKAVRNIKSKNLEELGSVAEIRSSFAALEPAVFGIFKPILFLPESLISGVTSQQFELILTHELCHVRRRDNLTSAIHMLVEAIFWFDPIVWFIGARLVEERECACDEEVMQCGGDPEVYSRSIIEICKCYLQAHALCASGICGSRLKDRIIRISHRQMGTRPGFCKNGLLILSLALTITVPALLGARPTRYLNHTPLQQHDWATAAGGHLAFDVASVKQNVSNDRKTHTNVPLGSEDIFSPTGGFFSSTNFPVFQYIIFAYKLNTIQTDDLSRQLPKWAMVNRYDIQARAPGNPSKDQYRLMMQTLLENRFKLRVHYRTKQMPVLALVLDKPGKLGPNLRPHPIDVPCSTSMAQSAVRSKLRGEFPEMCGVLNVLPASAHGHFTGGASNVPMTAIANMLSIRNLSGVDKPIVDRTGLVGNYDFLIDFVPDMSVATPGQIPDTSGMSFLAALKDELGLRLEQDSAPMEMIVVDYIERPANN